MPTRRQMLAHSARVAALLAAPGFARSQTAVYSTAAFEAKTWGDALKALGAAAPVASKDVTLGAPEIAENGAVVALTAATTLPGVRRLLILVEKNPNALAAVFEPGDGVEPHFATRVKMSQSSNVYAVALTTDGKAFFAHRDVKVTLGGCGN